MTDWFGGEDAVAQMKAGNDLLMPGFDIQNQVIEQAVKNGQLDSAVLDNNVRNILNIVLKTPTFKGFKYSNKPDLKKHAAIARAAASEGMVLLKNTSSTLPMAVSKTPIAVFGNYSYDMVTGGTGSGDVNEAYTVSLPQGMQSAGFSFNEKLAKQYNKYLADEKRKRPELTGLQKFMPQAPISEYAIDDKAITDSVKKSPMALITIGRTSGEFSDRHAKNDFYLSDNEQALITKVSQVYKAANKPVVVILNIGGVIEMASWQNKVDAILLAWQPGQEAGNAIADVLSGKVNPSGKLPTTFAKNLQSYPAFVNFPGEVTDVTAKPDMMGYVPAKVMYLDGTNVGYRHFDQAPEQVVYPFGYGLSYSTFDLADFIVKAAQETLTLDFTITNTSKVAGKQVAQIYALNSSEVGAQRTLKSFAKSKILKPGEKQAFSLTLPIKDLAEFDKNTQQWKLAAGQYRIELASSSQQSAASVTITLDKTKYFAL
jgi:beta-glucosidase